MQVQTVLQVGPQAQLRRQRAAHLSASEADVERHVLQLSQICRESSTHPGIAPLQPVHARDLAQFRRNRPAQKHCIPRVKRIGAQVADLRGNRARHHVRAKIEVLDIREQPQFRGQMTLKSKEDQQHRDNLIAAARDTVEGRRRGVARVRADLPARVLRPVCAVGRLVQGLKRESPRGAHCPGRPCERSRGRRGGEQFHAQPQQPPALMQQSALLANSSAGRPREVAAPRAC